MKSRMKKPVKESMDNLKNALDSDKDVVVTIDAVTAGAIKDNDAATENKEEVQKELDKKAKEGIAPSPNPEYGKMKENIYTKKYVLDESLKDFSIRAVK